MPIVSPVPSIVVRAARRARRSSSVSPSDTIGAHAAGVTPALRRAARRPLADLRREHLGHVAHRGRRTRSRATTPGATAAVTVEVRTAHVHHLRAQRTQLGDDRRTACSTMRISTSTRPPARRIRRPAPDSGQAQRARLGARRREPGARRQHGQPGRELAGLARDGAADAADRAASSGSTPGPGAAPRRHGGDQKRRNRQNAPDPPAPPHGLSLPQNGTIRPGRSTGPAQRGRVLRGAPADELEHLVAVGSGGDAAGSSG